jgi:hypothetical protein
MAWTSVPTKTGVTISGADWNTYVAGNMNTGTPQRILDTTLSVDLAGALDIQSIPQDFQHLQISMSLRSTQVIALAQVFMLINGDASASYDGLYLQGIAASFNVGEQLAQSTTQVANTPAASATSGLFGHCEIWIPNYAETAANKMLITYWQSIIGTATTNHESGQFMFQWRNSSAVESIQIRDAGTAGWAAGSRVTMRGWP